MSENQDSTLAPSSPLRDNLVETAVNFLSNPDVRRRHHDSKVQFLKKKGLTDAEIAASFERVQFDPSYSNQSVTSDSFRGVQPPIAVQPLWSRLSGLTSSLIIFGVAAYGLHHLYRKFIRPWLLGEDSETDSSLKHIKELVKNISLLTETVEKLHATVLKQNEDINKLLQIEGSSYAPTPMILEDLKNEVSSLKSILISRHQFPALPQTQLFKASIPSWQMKKDQVTNGDSAVEKTDQGDQAPQNPNANSISKEEISTTDTLVQLSTTPSNGILSEHAESEA